MYIPNNTYNWFWSIKRITQCMLVGCDAIRKLSSMKNEYALSVSELNYMGCDG